MAFGIYGTTDIYDWSGTEWFYAGDLSQYDESGIQWVGSVAEMEAATGLYNYTAPPDETPPASVEYGPPPDEPPPVYEPPPPPAPPPPSEPPPGDAAPPGDSGGGGPALAGLTSTGQVFVADGGVWRWIPDESTLAALGYAGLPVTWYGDLPGSLGEPMPHMDGPAGAGGPDLPRAYGGMYLTVGLPNGDVYVNANGTWRRFPDVDTFSAGGLQWSMIAWLPSLPPAPVGPDVPSIHGGGGLPSVIGDADPDGYVYGTIQRIGPASSPAFQLPGTAPTGKLTVGLAWPGLLKVMARDLPGGSQLASEAARRFLGAVD